MQAIVEVVFINPGHGIDGIGIDFDRSILDSDSKPENRWNRESTFGIDPSLMKLRVHTYKIIQFEPENDELRAPCSSICSIIENDDYSDYT